ncbi:hypothetical protein H8E07_17370 [bacterium]|nr:hypothetical protein [bacterium]
MTQMTIRTATGFLARLAGRVPAGPMLLLVLLAATLGCESLEPLDDGGPRNPPLAVVVGEDYSLPAHVTPEPYSGYSNHPEPGEPSTGMALSDWWVGWDELEPVRGEYDWDLVDARLASAAAEGTKLNIHLLSITWGGGSTQHGITVVNRVPEWILNKYELGETDLINLGWIFDILVIPGWHEEIQAEFAELIAAFGARGYPAHEGVGAMYIHGVSASRGEEFWLTQETVDLLEQDHGFGPEVLHDWISGRFRAFADAFAGHTHKLAWVGRVGAWVGRGNAYETVARDLVLESQALGFGNRNGGIESFHQYLKEPELGWDLDETGHLVVDETVPVIADTRYFGDENEEYGADWTWRFGPTTGDAYRYRMSMLRALQMRLRFLVTSPDAEWLNPPLSRYAGLSFGKTVDDSPDAWAYLKESKVHVGISPPGVIRNFERWLTQRDHPGGMTVPTERIDRRYNAGSIGNAMDGAYWDHAARRTDVAGGNPYIYFHLDDRFVMTGPVQIKVEILDAHRTTWRLEYTDAEGTIVTSESYTGRGDDEVRTVTFTLTDAAFANGLSYGSDFRIACDWPGDVVVRWVRVVRGV